MTRRIALALSALTVATLWAAVPQANASPGGGGCQLQGNATFAKPGLSNTPAAFKYSFSGTLSECQSNQSGAPTGGTVSAGQAVSINGEKFQEPVPTGSGSCAEGNTAGIAIVKWSSNKYTVIKYQTNSATAAVLLQGDVVASVKLKAIHPKKGQPKSTTIKTTQYTGDSALGTLTFQPSDPTACGGKGLTSAAINGFTGIGSES